MQSILKWFRRPAPSRRQLLAILLDKSADLATRDDIAMDLHACDDTDVEQALVQVALDHTEEEVLIDSAGESLWAIWQRSGKRDEDLIARMHPSAQKFFRK